MGRAWKFGDNLNTDVISPSASREADDPASYAMKPIRPEFAAEVEPGDVIVAGKNFGAGSSREIAVTLLLMNGIDCVIVEQAARNFFRNAVTLGLPIYIDPEAARGIDDGDEVEVDHDTGVITNLTTGESYQAESYPEFIQEMIDAGGLGEYHRQLTES